MRTERANAKINVYLNVTSRRENGYHEIVSMMQTVSLCDLVAVDFQKGKNTSIDLSVSGNPDLPTDRSNLCHRAAERFLDAAGLAGEVSIALEKRIPMAAGLAGGSADAAAVLRALNALCGKPFDRDRLCAVGAELGADIPFCIVGGSALVGGIGDRMEAIPPMPDGILLVACGGEGVSTPWAYGALDARYDRFVNPPALDPRPRAILEAWGAGDLVGSCPHFFNLFEEVVPAERPTVQKIKETMTAGGAIRAMMSGSGPSVFGIFRDEPSAKAVEDALRADGISAFLCRPTAESEI